MRSRQRWFALFALLLLVVPRLSAQQITGRVTNAQSGEPLPAVQVFIAGSGIGALSQQNGRFLLLNVPAGTHTLTAERIGYQAVTQRVAVAAGQTVVQDFRLSEQALGLDEIIVTGTPGGTQRRAIGNSVVSVDAAQVAQTRVITSVGNMLQGRNPGVLMGNAGAIGTGGDISIRGYGTFNRARSLPLLYVDGVRVNNDPAVGPNMSGGRVGNVLNDFDPEDIQSIEIIKGPAAATLYGSEASAGVIQIITKRGAEGTPEFTASITEGRNFVRSPTNKMGAQWACSTSASFPCRHLDGPLRGQINVDAIVPYYWFPAMNQALRQGGFNREWDYDHWPMDNVLQYGPSRGYSLGMRGGTERIRYFMAGSYDYNEGSEYWNFEEAVHTRANLGVVFSEMITLDVSTAFVRGKTSYTNQVGTRGGLWDQVAWGQGYCAPFVSPNPDVGCARKLGMQQFIPTDIAKISSTRDFDRFTGSGTLNFNTGGWLSSRVVFGIDAGWDKNEWVHPIETVQANAIQETLEGQAIYETPRNTLVSVDWSATGKYDVTDAIGTATSVGAQYFSKSNEFLGITGNGFASPLSKTINQTPTSRSALQYRYEENKSFGMFVQEQVGWNDRVFLTGALRFDANSTFGESFDPLVYPKLSGTWVVSEESFFNLDFIDELRFRGAWGKAGQQPSTFAGVNTYNAFAGPGGTSALTRGSIGNPAVGPEVSTELELGFDASALEGRIAGEFNWYKTRSEDNLLGIDLPPSVGGGGTVDTNVGVIDKWGWEASLRTRIYESRGTTFGIDFNGSYTMNEIKELGAYRGGQIASGIPSGPQFWARVGWPFPNAIVQQHVVRAEFDPRGPIVDPYGRRIQVYCDAGVLLDPDPNANPRQSKYGVVLGGKIVPCDQTAGYPIVQGNRVSPYNWSIMPTISVGNGALQINAKVDGQYGRIGDDQIKLWLHRYNTAYGTIGQDDALYYAGYRLNQWQQMQFYEGGFWKLREAGVRYQLPEALAKRFGADRASLGFSGRNLLVLWWEGGGALGVGDVSPEAMNMPPTVGIDPEHGSGVLGHGGLRTSPTPTSFHLRLDVTF
jgi:TonB-linked SusC/RagA family outer membrane protein